MTTPIVIVGAGGQARVIAAALQHAGGWDVAGVLDENPGRPGELILGYKVIGTYADLAALQQRGIRHAFVALGDNAGRAALFDRLSALGFILPALVHPRAFVEPSATIGRGTIVCAGAIVGVLAAVGENCIINTSAVVDHETTIGNHSHVGPGSRVGGRVRIGERVFIGLGVSVRDRMSVGSGATIGAGSVVVGDIPSSVVAYGVPARVARNLPS